MTAASFKTVYTYETQPIPQRGDRLRDYREHCNALQVALINHYAENGCTPAADQLRQVPSAVYGHSGQFCTKATAQPAPNVPNWRRLVIRANDMEDPGPAEIVLSLPALADNWLAELDLALQQTNGRDIVRLSAKLDGLAAMAAQVAQRIKAGKLALIKTA